MFFFVLENLETWIFRAISFGCILTISQMTLYKYFELDACLNIRDLLAFMFPHFLFLRSTQYFSSTDFFSIYCVFSILSQPVFQYHKLLKRQRNNFCKLGISRGLIITHLLLQNSDGRKERKQRNNVTNLTQKCVTKI